MADRPVSTADSVESGMTYQPLRAPAEDFGLLVEPPRSGFAGLLDQNQRRRRAADGIDIGGKPLGELSEAARVELISESLRYTQAYRDVPNAWTNTSANTPLIVAGHQPQLFHPGVWFKNFALAKLAREHKAVAVNLVIDSDAIRGAVLRVPGGTVDAPTLSTVPFDAAGEELPFEERPILDLELLKAFGGEAGKSLRFVAPDALLPGFWPKVIERAAAVDRLGLAISQARHQQEAAFGLSTLELPQSFLSRFGGYVHLTSHVLADLPRLHQTYNEAVADYRRVNKVRSTAHPVPDLAAQDDWLEAPLWIWSVREPVRRRLFVRRVANQLELSDRHYLLERIPSAQEDVGASASALVDLEQRGIKLRTRALMTTLFVRLLLGDVFLHGIGGAKYDQVTDQIARRWLGVHLPGYMTLTATLRLPVAKLVNAPQDAASADEKLRQLAYHPERSLNGKAIGEARELLAEKQAAVASAPSISTVKRRRAGKAARQTIRHVNEKLQAFLTEPLHRALEMKERESGEQAARAILQSREYPFCFFPEESLRRLVELA